MKKTTMKVTDRNNGVVVRDLRTGHLLHRVPTGISENPPEEAGVGYVTETVVKSDGAVAWIVDNFGLDVGLPPETVPYFEVKALDGAGLRTLAGARMCTHHSRLPGVPCIGLRVSALFPHCCVETTFGLSCGLGLSRT